MRKVVRTRVLFTSIILICVLPLFGAWLVFSNPQWISGATNYGRLIVPVVKLDRTLFIGLDKVSQYNIDQLKGRWVLVHFITGTVCGLPCLEALHKTKQVRLMLNQDLMRVRRLLVGGDADSSSRVSTPLDNEGTLLRVRADESFIARISAVLGGPLDEGMLFLMDPLGNLMMWYPSGFDPYHVKKDMKKLLNVSQIG